MIYGATSVKRSWRNHKNCTKPLGVGFTGVAWQGALT